MSSQLMPSERICLKRTREQLIRSLDVTSVLPRLRGQNVFSRDEEAHIMADSRRRERVVMFLDFLEKKNSEAFKAFSNVLADQNPHLYLIMSDWDKDDGGQQSNAFYGANHASIDDEWDVINRSRDYLLSQIDGAEIVPLLDNAGILTADQRRMILEEPVRERRSQSLLDVLEMKQTGAYKVFIDAIGELYPHVYLELTGSGGMDDDDW